MDISYVPLRLRSNYSLLAGTMTLEEIVGRASRMGLKAVALTDVNNLYGAVAFQRLTRSRGLKGVLGIELRTGSQSAVLLARDRRGYRNLCRAATRLHLGARSTESVGSHRRPGAGLPEGSGESCAPPPPLVELLAGGVEGLHCIVEDTGLAETMADLFPRDRLWLELAAPGRAPGTWARTLHKARDLRVGVVATGDVWFGDPQDWGLHRALRAMAGRTLVTRAAAQDGVVHPSSFMAAPAQMARRLGKYSWALCQAAALAEDCNLELETGRHVFPSCSLGLGETPLSRLRSMCRDGLRARFGPSPGARVLGRLERELDVIDKLGFCPYFIVVGEIVAWARRRGVSVVGRGSGASSLVAYLLGITGVDPLRHGLCFERFLNSRRPDYPDLDIDLCWRRRDEVIQHVYDTYGADRVAMISTHVTFRGRSALREMAKVWGLAPRDVSLATRSWGLDGQAPMGLDAGPHARRQRGDWKSVPAREPLSTVVKMAKRIQGFPRHLGIHCGGVVVAPGPLGDMVPLERARKGVVVTQYEMHAVESLGLVKMDLLGNRGLTVAQECIELANTRGAGLALEDIPDADPAAARLLSGGETLGCFQIESPAMRQLLAMVAPRDSDEVIAAVALVRPGPAGSGMKDAFVRRKRGLEQASFAHPCVTPVLSSTYGVMLYEEDVLKVTAVCAGISLEDGDNLRRAIAEAEGEGEREKVRRGFVDLARRRGIGEKAAEALWRDLARFSSYAFCKAHAAGYGLLAYRTAYLKAHYPAEFAVAVLNNHAGMYPTRVHLEDARRRGLEVRGPCVNRSGQGFIAEDGAVRVGLGSVKGMRAAAVDELLRARAKSPFKSLADLLARVSLTAAEAESLVLAGALDFAGVPRPSLLLEVLAGVRSKAKNPRGREALLAGIEVNSCISGIRDFDPQLRLEMERRHMDLTPSGHPMGDRRDVLVQRPGGARPMNPALQPVTCAALRRYLGRTVAVTGVVSASRRIRTGAGRPMLFLTIEDATGLVETVIFPGAYRSAADALEEHEALLVTGRVEDHYGALTLVAEEVAPVARHSAIMPAVARGGSGSLESGPEGAESEVTQGRAESELVEGRLEAGRASRQCGRGWGG